MVKLQRGRQLVIYMLSSIFVIVDQMVKLWISSQGDFNISIISDFVYIHPILNTKYSWINSLFDLGIGRGVHIIISLAVIIILLSYCDFLDYTESIGYIDIILFTLLLSGAVCSLLDKVLWNGSLDFIQVRGVFTFDIKDIYLNIGILSILAKSINKNKMNNPLRNYISYLKKCVMK